MDLMDIITVIMIIKSMKIYVFMKLKKILARVMVFVFYLNLIYINVNAEENKVLNEDNAVVTENKENKKRETTKGSTFKKNLDKAANAAKSGIKSVYQLAKTGVKYAAIGCCFAFGFYTFKHVKHKTKHIIKNMRKTFCTMSTTSEGSQVLVDVKCLSLI